MRCALPAVPWLVLLLLNGHGRPALAQGPGWLLGEPDDCQRKEIAAEPQQHRFWTDAAPVTLYQYAYLQPDAAAAAHPADDPPRRRIQLQKRRINAQDLWHMDQDIPAFDFSYSLVSDEGCRPSAPRAEHAAEEGRNASVQAATKCFAGHVMGCMHNSAAWHSPDVHQLRRR